MVGDFISPIGKALLDCRTVLGSPTTIMKIRAKHSAVVLVAMYGLEAASNSISLQGDFDRQMGE